MDIKTEVKEPFPIPASVKASCLEPMDLDNDDEREADAREIDGECCSPMSQASTASTDSETSPSVLFLFDWDDTLLASSYLQSKGYRLDRDIADDDEIWAPLKQLELAIIRLLTLASQFGEVRIVTNAETGWVQLSAQKYVPRLTPYLAKFRVISARSTYERQHPDCPHKWKYCAFNKELQSIFPDAKSAKHVLSFGDSNVEREAIRAVTKNLDNIKTKSVKFAERPSMEQLRRQIELVTNSMDYIFNQENDLDLMLTISLVQ